MRSSTLRGAVGELDSCGQLPRGLVDCCFARERPSDLVAINRKFGKQIQRRQLDLPEYAASFVNYKALKKVGPWLSLAGDSGQLCLLN